MSRRLQIKRGLKENLPFLAQGELAMVTNSGAEEVHIGTGTGENIQLARHDELEAKAPSYTYGTEDLTAGTSPLETGKLYFVYE